MMNRTGADMKQIKTKKRKRKQSTYEDEELEELSEDLSDDIDLNFNVNKDYVMEEKSDNLPRLKSAEAKEKIQKFF